MSNNGKGWFPRYLTAPIQVFVWEMDEAFPFLAFWLLGFIFGSVLFFGAVGIFLSWLVVKYKQNLPEGFLQNLFYAIGVRPMQGYPSYFCNNFRE